MERPGNDTINISNSNGVIQVVGTAPNVAIFHAESTDQLLVNAGVGNDTINATTLPATTITLVLDGGDGNDTIFSAQGSHTLLGKRQRPSRRRRRQQHPVRRGRQ